MPKRRITHRQAERIKKIQQKRLQRAAETYANNELFHDTGLGAEQAGLLIAHYGKTADIEATDGKIYRCLLRQNLGLLVVGDQIVWRANSEESGVVVAVKPRQTIFGRLDPAQEIRPLVANIDQIMVVIALEPLFFTTVLDSYLVAAETLNIPAKIVFNKIDLSNEKLTPSMLAALEIYRKIPYSLLEISAHTQQGIETLKENLKNKTSVFIGQSGVGKSSLITCLLPDVDILIGDLSLTTQKGRHTTTTARLYHLPGGGNLIDAPGIREFELWHMPAEKIAQGFLEFKPYLGKCKFSDCRHREDPGCALQEAVILGKISKERLANFHRLTSEF